jgi:phage terminase large subunit-like protein
MRKIQKRIESTTLKIERASLPIDNNHIQESNEVKIRRLAHLEADPEKWFAYYFRKYATSKPASFHKAATQRIMANPEWYEVRMWSRELAKTTRTMMEVLYLVLVGHATPNGRLKKKYVLMISNSFDNACRLLQPYKLSLEKNEYLIRDYGRQKRYGLWKSGEFVTHSGAAFRALGAGQSPRGTRNEARRPDVILFDDVDTDINCLNPDNIAKKWRWIEEAAISTRSISEPLLIIFCGNRIAIDCCVQRATVYANHTDRVNILDDAGSSTWPEKNSLLHIERVLKQKSYMSQQKEYFNNPIQEGAVFKEMKYKPALPLQKYDMLLCYTDPSHSDSRKSDYKATVLVGRLGNEFHVIKCYVQKTTTQRMIDWHYKMHKYLKGVTCYFYIEENPLQESLMRSFAEAGRKIGEILPIKPDNRAKKDKFTRIESLLEPLHSNDQLFLNLNEKNSPDMHRLEEQFISISANSRAHDDAPDAVEGAVFLLMKKSNLLKPESIWLQKRQPGTKSY